MSDDLRVVYESVNRAACADRALVLSAVEIPHGIVDDAGVCVIVVPAEHSARAVVELAAYDEENPPPVPIHKPVIHYQDPVPGVVSYLLVICVVAWLAGLSVLGHNWTSAGRVDGILIRDGELWRTITALTLHADLKHLAGNIVFGTLFGLFAGRLLGSGVAWLAILLTGATGNLINTLLLEPAHRAIGASTAVFAALGLVAGFVWQGKLMSQERWTYRYGPIVGGLALLMYTGTGGPNTDIGAHLLGFVSGFAGGMVLVRFRHQLKTPHLQVVCGGVALIIVVAAWTVALQF